MNELALFMGAGGGLLGGKLLGWRTVCGVEIDAFCARRVMQRQNEGHLPPFPIWDDVRTFRGGDWRGIVDVVSGGFPCQDISAAGKGAGIDGEASGLWREMARIIGDVQPRYAFIENSPMLTIRGLDKVICDLAALGFDAEWECISAAQLGAPHKRERIWIVAHAKWDKQPREKSCDGPPGRVGRQFKSPAWHRDWQGSLREFRGVDDGLAYGVERLDAIRNGQVPIVAATAWEVLTA